LRTHFRGDEKLVSPHKNPVAVCEKALAGRSTDRKQVIMGKNGNGKQLAVQEPSILLMLETLVTKGVTADNVAALDSLAKLHERMQDKQAERDFNAAFAKLQNEMPTIDATSPVPNKDGSIRYRFAPFESLMETAKPVLISNGFSISFSSRAESDRIVSVCTLRHISGHSQTNEFAVRIGQGPPGATITQADGAAKTYAKRGALCDALNLVVEHDDDARMIGKPIGKALGEELFIRVKELGSKVDEQAFLKFAGVACSNPAKPEDYAEIGEDRFDALDAMLKRKEGRLV
jgi:hypothetical protein